MQRIAVFGKGGIGKSTVAANLAVLYAQRGLKVLLVGCDPKHDTTIALTDGKPIPTVVERGSFMDPARSDGARTVVKARLGIDCVEAGGPEPGIGCAGRGISRMIEVLEAAGVLREDRYDVALFDVLGDVVCGGFAAPLRQGLADKVCIVASEELMALYAANNIARAVRNYKANGAVLCGMLANLRDPGADRAMVERFALLIGTRVLAFIPRDPIVRGAEFAHRTVVEHAPDSAIAAVLRRIADELLGFDTTSAPELTPLTDASFHALARASFEGGLPAQDAIPESGRGRSGSAPDPAPAAAARRPPEAPQRRAWTPNWERQLATLKARSPVEREGSNAAQWGAADQWRRFFCDPEAQRNRRSGIEVRARMLSIKHQDLECSFATPNFERGGVSFFNFPWPPRPRMKRGLERERWGSEIMTDMRDPEVIHGGTRKLEAALDAVSGLPQAPDAVMVYSTCVPTVIGDDVEAVVEKYRGKLSVPIAFSNPAANREVDVGRTMLRKVFEDPATRGVRKRANCVNLVGFPEGPGLDELMGLLREAGVSVNAQVMPGISLEQAKTYLAAGIQVLYPNEDYEATYRELFLPLPVESLRLEAPYGIVGTRRWLLGVASRLGLGSGAEAAVKRALRGMGPAWWEGRREAAGHRLAFVLDAARVARLTEPARLWGVPVVRLLREMGFGLDIVFYEPKGQAPAPFLGFATPEELQARLKEGSFEAVYSEFFFDSRLTRAGKSQFSLAAFEMGLAGALRSMKRLNEVCRWPFYRRYARYLEAS